VSDEYRPRISIDLTPAQKRLLDKHIPWGSKKTVFNVVIDDLLNLCEQHGSGKVVGAFISRHIHLRDICKLDLPPKDT
jgi:hypothetical protein